MVRSRLTKAVTGLDEWLVDIGLLLNASKTQAMVLKPHAVIQLSVLSSAKALFCPLQMFPSSSGSG